MSLSRPLLNSLRSGYRAREGEKLATKDTNVFVSYEDARDILNKHQWEYGSILDHINGIDEFYCKNCNNNKWEISSVSKMDNNKIFRYEICIDTLWCVDCKKDCKRSDIYTKQERRNEKLDFLIHRS